MTNPPCGGIDPLREAIAKYLKEFRGMTGAAGADDLSAQAQRYLYGLLIQLLGTDKIYAVENPGYRKIAKRYRSWKVACEYIDMDEEGVQIGEPASASGWIFSTLLRPTIIRPGS